MYFVNLNKEKKKKPRHLHPWEMNYAFQQKKDHRGEYCPKPGPKDKEKLLEQGGEDDIALVILPSKASAYCSC